MGLTELGQEDGELIDKEDLTVADLIDIFGREATRRGLEYIRSLHKADEEFRKSANHEVMEKGYRDIGVEGDLDEVAGEWEAATKRKGLGLEDEDTEN